MADVRAVVAAVSVLGPLILLAIPVDALGQQSMKAHRDALVLLRQYADVVCPEVSTTGDWVNRTFDARARVGLNAVLKKVVDLGLEGGVKYQDARYRGVLQKDLAVALRDSNRCRMMVLETLADRLLPDKRASSGNPLPYVMLNSEGKLAHVPVCRTAEECEMLNSEGKLAHFPVFRTAEDCLNRLPFYDSFLNRMPQLQQIFWDKPSQCRRLPQESVWCMTVKEKDSAAKKVCQLSIRDCHEAYNYVVNAYDWVPPASRPKRTVQVTQCEQFSAYELWEW